jgi:recombination associated protein RdgC
MFKALSIYTIAPGWQPNAMTAQQGLEALPFVECTGSQAESIGWIAPRGAPHTALMESVAGHWHLRLMIERKIVPASVIARRVQAMAADIERQTGRKPGRKESKELKDQALLELLPVAFTKQTAISVWIDPTARLLMIDTTSATVADDVLRQLSHALSGFSVRPLLTQQSPSTVMAEWLLAGEPPAPFTIDRDCELKTPDEMKSAVRYARHQLDSDELRHHIKAGKRPTQLALTWHSRVSFVLTDTGLVKKIDFLDGVFVDDQPTARTADDAFDADAAIGTGELSRMLPELFEALGGVMGAEGGAA